MQFFKKIPFLLGWLVFSGSTWLLQWLLVLFIIPYASIGFLLVIYVVLSLFTFGFSVTLITLPLYRASRLRLISYLLKWLTFLVYYALYCIPLSIKDLLPANLKLPFLFGWSFIAGYLAFRGVVRPWLDDSILGSQQEREKRVLRA